MYQEAVAKARTRRIRPRAMDLEIPADTPRWWMDGDPYATHVLNAFSTTFPPGEKLFMAAVRAFRDQIEDPALKEQVKGFLAQEALHSREHSILNAWLDRMGYPAARFEQEVAEDISSRRATRPAIQDLAVTCALEHFTAIMAQSWLENPELRERCHPNLRALWLWHAVEELEHKAVAFDVYQAVGGEYQRRVLTMAVITLGFIAGISIFQAQLMKKDGVHRDLGVWARGIWKYWGPRGQFTRMIPAYLRYYRRDFHPMEHDDEELLARGEAELSALTGIDYSKPTVGKSEAA